MGGLRNDGSRGFFEIVGIVADQHDTRLDADFEPYMYVPYKQQALRFMCFALRTTVDPLSLVTAVRKEVAAVTREEAPFEFASMGQLRLKTVAKPLSIMVVLGGFAVTALGLAALGIYGMLAYLVSRRTHDIGVRVALGAQRRDVLCLVLRQGFALTAVGLCIGLLVSLAGTRVLSSMLYETAATDLGTFIGAPVLLGAIAMLACYIPARRATKVDPMVALRCE